MLRQAGESQLAQGFFLRGHPDRAVIGVGRIRAMMHLSAIIDHRTEAIPYGAPSQRQPIKHVASLVVEAAIGCVSSNAIHARPIAPAGMRLHLRRAPAPGLPACLIELRREAPVPPSVAGNLDAQRPLALATPRRQWCRSADLGDQLPRRHHVASWRRGET